MVPTNLVSLLKEGNVRIIDQSASLIAKVLTTRLFPSLNNRYTVRFRPWLNDTVP